MHRLTLIAAAIALCVAASLVPDECRAGAFIFASDGSPDVITHPSGYTGDGGSLVVSVCINPASANAAAMVPTVQNVVATFNAQLPTLDNLRSGSSNNIPSNHIDFESVALHEVGHCLGMAHPNAATESGLPSNQRDYTRAGRGPNLAFNLNAGPDGIIGSHDDLRGDDVNLHWFRRSNNDPFTIAPVVDVDTYGRDLASLPSGHAFAANPGRDVAAGLGIASTEAVMQQLTYIDEAQRTLGHDDVATLRLAMAGLDRVAATSDDYTLSLAYAGLTTACDITINFSTATSLAQCGTTATYFNTNHLRITSASVLFNPNFNWFFNPLAAPTPTPTSTQTPTRTPTITPTRTPTTTPTDTPVPTPTPTRSTTSTATVTATRTHSPTATATSTPLPTHTATATPLPVSLSGTIVHFASSVPIPAVDVAADGSAQQTNVFGEFAVTIAGAGPHAIVPSADFPVSAIGALDAVAVLALATQSDDATLAETIACDASGNGRVSAFDAALLLRLLVGLEPALPVAVACNSPWAFVPAIGVGSPGTAQWPLIATGQCDPGAIVHDDLPPTDDQQNFVGIPFGDCNGDWQPEAHAETLAEASAASEPTIEGGPLRGRPRMLRFPVNLAPGTPVRGFEATIQFDPQAFEVVDVRKVGDVRATVFASYANPSGTLKIAFATADVIIAGDSPLFVVHFESLRREAHTSPVLLTTTDVDGTPARIDSH